MTDKKKLGHLAYILKDLSSLRNLFAELNFDFADEPVNKENWNDSEKEIILESRIVAKKNDYRIYYLQTNTDSLKYWKSVATKIIKENHGFCLVCSHNPSGFKWVFSSLSKEFSKSFTETRHVPIEIRPNIGVPNNFVEFLDRIKIGGDSTAISIASQVSESFDTFAIEIHNELTVNVYGALKTLSEGIIGNKSNKLSLSNETLEEIRTSIFTLLYRIIFILYAEDRGIFPVEDPTYHEKFSLKWIKEEWLLKSTKLAEYEVQKRLKDLFKLIELGSEAFDYPKFSMRSYYGRLFDREINSKLESWKISNSHLIKMLEFLTRTRDRKGNYFFLDYAALETRHLGAVYEHLLEFHLEIKNKKIAELPNTEERKASGSYYTPKYIVDYIVENSIEPLIDKIINENPDKQIQIEKILELKILDPAMGSGHFLVGAIEYVAKRLCEIEFGEIAEQAYIERKRDVVRRCIYGVDINPLAVDLANLSLWLETLSSEKPLSFLRSHLKCGNSLVGSKIESIFGERDIHNKTTQTTLFESQKHKNAFKKNIKNFLMFENLEDNTPSAVKIKLEEYSKMQSKGTIYKDLQFLLNCKTAESFGVKLPVLFRDYSTKIGENSLDYYSDEDFQNVDTLSKQETFFHWELEFPQIFYDENGNKKTNNGFDCIIGNPPYDVLIKSKTDPNLLKFLKNGYINESVSTNEDKKTGYLSAEYNPNLFALFIEKSIELLKNESDMGLIIQNSLYTNKYFKNIRKIILEHSKIMNIVDFRYGVFADAVVDSSIIILQKTSDMSKINVNKINVNFNLQQISELYDSKKIVIFNQSKFHDEKSDYRFSIYIGPKINHIFSKLDEIETKLENYVEINRGIGLVSPGNRHKISLFTDKKQSKKHKPVFVGKDVSRYFVNWTRNWAKIDNDTIVGGTKNPVVHEAPEKLIFPRIRNLKYSQRILAGYDDKKIWVLDNYNILRSKNSKTELKFILGLINSKLLNFYFRNKFVDVNIKGGFVKQLPIIIPSLNVQKKIIALVNKMINLNLQLLDETIASEEINKAKETMEKTSSEIDSLVYQLYGIPNNDVEIIEST